MVNGIQYYNGYLNSLYSSGVGRTSSPYNTKSINEQAQALLEAYQSGSGKSNTLKADSSEFLNTYMAGMKTQKDAATSLMGGNLDKLLYNRQGEVTENTIAATVDATQKLVDAHNANLKLLNDNYDRGSGVQKQLMRMVDNPAGENEMAAIGLSMNDDGTMSLDAAKLAEALGTGDAGQLDIYKNTLGGAFGVASNLQSDASFGISVNSGALIENDLAAIQEQYGTSNNLFGSSSGNYTDYSDYTKDDFKFMSGFSKMSAYGLSNMGAVGMMMNILA